MLYGGGAVRLHDDEVRAEVEFVGRLREPVPRPEVAVDDAEEAAEAAGNGDGEAVLDKVMSK